MRDEGLEIDSREVPERFAQRSFPCEHFVDADQAAEFLMVNRKTILDWARASVIPAHPFGRASESSGASVFRNWLAVTVLLRAQ